MHPPETAWLRVRGEKRGILLKELQQKRKITKTEQKHGKPGVYNKLETLLLQLFFG